MQTDVRGGKSEAAWRMDVSSLGPKHRMMPGKLSQSISYTNPSGVLFPVCLHCCNWTASNPQDQRGWWNHLCDDRKKPASAHVCVCVGGESSGLWSTCLPWSGGSLSSLLEENRFGAGMPTAHWCRAPYSAGPTQTDHLRPDRWENAVSGRLLALPPLPLGGLNVVSRVSRVWVKVVLLIKLVALCVCM